MSDQGTRGVLIAPNFNRHTIELPWRDNAPNVSSIPPGAYICKLRRSRKFGLTYCLQDVPHRSYVLIHAGNVAGDTECGYKTHSAGCILVGKMPGRIWGQDAVLSSRPALREFMSVMDGKPFRLEVR